MYKDRDRVEFTMNVTCRVIYPRDEGSPKSQRVLKDTIGRVIIGHVDFKTLPGDVAVMVTDPEFGRVIVSARLGTVVPVSIQTDDNVTVKVYRNTREVIKQVIDG